MYWNHRVIKTYYPEWDETTYAIHEVFYDDNDKVEMWTEGPVAVFAETMEAMTETLAEMLACQQKPVLNREDLPGAGLTKPDQSD